MRTIPALSCTWKGITLTVTRMTDQAGYDWVQHVYPGRDGAELEPMGRKAQTYRVEAVFFGPDWFSDLLVFRAAVEQPGAPDTFVHPFWGSITGVVTDMEITHEDRRFDAARVVFSFLEGVAAPFAFAASTSMASAAAAATAAAATASSAAAGLAG